MIPYIAIAEASEGPKDSVLKLLKIENPSKTEMNEIPLEGFVVEACMKYINI